MSAPGGCLLLGGVCSRGSAPGGSALGGSAPGGGVSAPRGGLLQGGVSQHALRQTFLPPLWTEFLTHASENITLAQLRCGR